MRSLPRIIFIFLVLLSLAQAGYYYPLLPDRVASHFGASGRPDAWSSKESFLKMYLIVIAFMAVLFPGIGWIIRKIPVGLINLPNKDHWLAPERREETIDFLARQFLWPGSATLVLFLDVFRQTFRVHLGKAESLEHAWTSLAAYAVFSIAWSLWFVAKFRRRR